MLNRAMSAADRRAWAEKPARLVQMVHSCALKRRIPRHNHAALRRPSLGASRAKTTREGLDGAYSRWLAAYYVLSPIRLHKCASLAYRGCSQRQGAAREEGIEMSRRRPAWRYPTQWAGEAAWYDFGLLLDIQLRVHGKRAVDAHAHSTRRSRWVYRCSWGPR